MSILVLRYYYEYDVTNPRITYKQDIEHSCRNFNFIIVYKMLENTPWLLHE